MYSMFEFDDNIWRKCCGFVALGICFAALPGIEAQSCNSPPAIGNGYITSVSPYNDGEVVIYTCQEGYNMAGDADGVACSAGTWVGDKPTCSTNDSKSLSIQMYVLIAIGIALGILLMIGLILLCVYCCCKRQSAYVGPGGFFGTYNVTDRGRTKAQEITTKKVTTHNKQTSMEGPAKHAQTKVISQSVSRFKEKAKGKSTTATVDTDPTVDSVYVSTGPIVSPRCTPKPTPVETSRTGDGHVYPAGESYYRGTTRKSDFSSSDAGYASSRQDTFRDTPTPIPFHAPNAAQAKMTRTTDATIAQFVKRNRNPAKKADTWVPHTHGVREGINTITT